MPCVAVAYLLWAVFVVPASRVDEFAPVYALLSFAIAVSAWMPSVALFLVVAAPGLQALRLVAVPDESNWPMYLATVVVAFVVGFRARGAVRWIAVLALGIAALLVGWFVVMPGEYGEFVSNSLVPDPSMRRVAFALTALAAFGAFLSGWSGGLAVASLLRTRAVTNLLDRATADWEEASSELAAAQDRDRIAREVHDALAHSLAVIVSQAQGAAAVAATRPNAVGGSLQTIAEVSRTALTDVRQLVEHIQNDDVGERHSIDDLPGLLRSMTQIGMRVELDEHGRRPALAPATQLAVFRIVQESLTNALKHGGPESEVLVDLDWRGDGLALLVESRGDRPLVPAGNGQRRGAGIRGMSDRARLAGGWLSTDRAEDGAFIVTAHIPVERELVDG